MGGSLSKGGLHPEGGLCPGGSLCSGGGSVQRGGPCPGRRVSVQGEVSPPYGYMPAVRILVEYILVINVDWSASSPQMFIKFKLSYR